MHKPSALRLPRVGRTAAEIRKLREHEPKRSRTAKHVPTVREAGRREVLARLKGRRVVASEFLFAAHIDGCMRWGLCDTGAANALPADVKEEVSDVG